MPRATFTGVKLVFVSPTMNVEVKFPDVSRLSVFELMKDACDEVLAPPLALDGTPPEGKGGKSG